MNPAHPNFRTRLLRPAVVLVLGLGVSAGLMFLPEQWLETARGRFAWAQRPAQRCAGMARRSTGHLAARLRAYHDTAAKLAEAEARLEALQQENGRLAAELAALETSRLTDTADPTGRLDPLLVTRCVPAVVLGLKARAMLGREHLLDAGTAHGVEPDALVVDAPAGLIDQGENAEIGPGQLVLSGGRVWGKVVHTGPQTAAVRTVTEPGYRDLVRLAGENSDGSLHPGPRGLLEGTGESRLRIRQVPVTEPVAVGDVVTTAASEGVLTQPLIYGRVVRVQRPVGAAHWEIWAEPAVAPGEPERVAVLRTELNPTRVASGRW